MFRTMHIKAALGLAAIAAAAIPAAATASPLPLVPVAAGQLQHTVTQYSWPSDRNTFQHDTLREERWITATAGRVITTDAVTGQVQSDCQYSLAQARCYESIDYDAAGNNVAPHGVIWIYDGSASLLESWADVGNGIKTSIGTPGGYTQTGTTTFLGHPAIVLTQPTSKDADGGTGSETVIAEADNDYPLFREDVTDNPGTANNRPGGAPITVHDDEVTQTTTLETISPVGIQLTIGQYPGATVKDERAKTVASASKHHKPTHKKPKHKAKKVVRKHTAKSKGYGKK
jgi:hypothetical protein